MKEYLLGVIVLVISCYIVVADGAVHFFTGFTPLKQDVLSLPPDSVSLDIDAETQKFFIERNSVDITIPYDMTVFRFFEKYGFNKEFVLPQIKKQMRIAADIDEFTITKGKTFRIIMTPTERKVLK